MKPDNSRHAICFTGLALAAGAFAIIAASIGRIEPARSASAPAPAPASFQLTATIRDFRGRDQSGGHTDFEWTPSSGYGHYVGQVADMLGHDGVPQYKSAGNKVTREWTDGRGRNIMPPRAHVNGRPDDVPGAAQSSPGGSLHSAAAFDQWFRDTPGVNQSLDIPFTLRLDTSTNMYVFDDRTDPEYSVLGGFFPINGKLFGNYSNTGKNYHFTCVLEAQFTYQGNSGHSFTFRGDDDVWVYIDNRLVIDLGGVHAAYDQTVDLDRLNWLVDGRNYTLKFFFAERHTTLSNFRIETSLVLRDANPHRRPAVIRWEEEQPQGGQ